MNITDKDGLWRLTHGYIENMKTGVVRSLKETPCANTIAYMQYDKYLRKCSIAFQTGAWPKTHWKSGSITD